MRTQKIQDPKSLDIENYRQLLDILFSAHQSISIFSIMRPPSSYVTSLDGDLVLCAAEKTS